MRRATCNHRKRRGLVLIAALVCLVVSVAIVGTMLKSALTARRQLHTERNLRQAELLLQAGFDRAAAQLAGNSSFTGDTWNLTDDELLGRGAGRVVTSIDPAASNGKSPWQIHVTAEYPLGRDFPIRRSQTFEIVANAFQSKE